MQREVRPKYCSPVGVLCVRLAFQGPRQRRAAAGEGGEQQPVRVLHQVAPVPQQARQAACAQHAQRGLGSLRVPRQQRLEQAAARMRHACVNVKSGVCYQ